METEKKYTVFDFDKLSMSSTVGKAKLRFGIYRNNPRISIYTNDPEDAKNNYGIITAPLDPMVFMTMLELLQDLSDKPSANNVKYKLDNMTLVNVEGSGQGNFSKKEMKLLSNVFIGKDEEGVIWISVASENRPKFKFEFGNFMFHKFYRPDGSQMTKAELSIVAAKAAVKLLSNIFSTYVTTNYEHMPASAFKKGSPRKPNTSNFDGDDLPY